MNVGYGMEPVLGGRAALVLAHYNRLRLEIQALVAENQELMQAVRILWGQQQQQQASWGPMVTPPLRNASERQFFPSAAPACACRPQYQGAAVQHPSREQDSEQGSWSRLLLPAAGGGVAGGILGSVDNEPLLQTTSSLAGISAGRIPLADISSNATATCGPISQDSLGIASGCPLPQGSLGIASGCPIPQCNLGIASGGPIPQGSLGIASGGPIAMGSGTLGTLGSTPLLQSSGVSTLGSISSGPIPQGSLGIASGGPIAMGSGTLGTLGSTPLLQSSGSTLRSTGTIMPIVQGGGSFGSSIIAGPILQGGGSSIGSISGISAGPVAHSTGPIPLGSGSFGSSGGSIITGPTVQSAGSIGSISGISAAPVAQSTGPTAQGSGTLGTLSSQPLLQSGSTLGSSGGGTVNAGPQGSGSTGTISGGSFGTITGGQITQGGGGRSFLAVPSPSGSPPLASHSLSSASGNSPQVPPQDNPEPPQDSPVSPRDVPVSPRDVPASPQDVPASPRDAPASPRDAPASPRDIPVSPRDVSMPPQDVPMSPQDVPVPAQNVSVSEAMMPEMSSFGLQMPDLQVSRARASHDASRVLSGLDQPQTSTPGAPAGVQRQMWEQLVGEVAFQLDRRILSRVFPDHPRVYGFTVSNIPEKIMAISLGGVPEAVAEQWASAAVQRYLGLMRQLRPLGYSPSVHPAFAESLINTYGIRADRAVHNPGINVLHQVITEIVPGEAREKALQLLHCLHTLAQDDGRPLFC